MAEPILSVVMFSLIGLGALYYHFRHRNNESQDAPKKPHKLPCSLFREEPKYPLSLRVMIAHESGHALISWYSSYVVSIDEIKIMHSRGHVMEIRTSSENPDALYDLVVMTLAGLAAEVIVIGKIGSAFKSRSDLRRARKYVIAILMESHRPIVKKLLSKYSEDDFRLDIGSMFKEAQTTDVRILLNSGYLDAKKRIMDHRQGFDRLQRKLLEQRTLNSEEIAKLFGPRIWGPR